MGANDNKPWACLKATPSPSLAQLFHDTKTSLYLFHFFPDLVPGTTNANWSLSTANQQWAHMKPAIASQDTELVALCSASSPNAWLECADTDVFVSSVNSHQVPYDLWVMAIGDPLVHSHADASVRFALDTTTTPFTITRDSGSKYPLDDDKACLPEAIALRWLLRNRKDQTLAALQQAGFSRLVSHETPYVQLLAKDGAVVLEGVAGIGKTHSISKVREGLAEVCPQGLITTLDTFIKGLENKQPSNCDVVAELKKLAPPPPCSLVKTSIFVMHPSTSYEEMIGGLRPKARRPATAGSPSPATGQEFEWQPGKMTRVIKDARDDLSNGTGRCHLVVLDEINRCNLPSVLGELIYLIEPSRRISYVVLGRAKQSVAAGSSTSDDDYLCDKGYAVPLGPEGDGVILCIPENLFFLGTMNSSDRSILGFDQALRRRFPPYRLEPMTVGELLKALHEKANELKTTVSADLKAITAWGYLNVILRCVIGPDAMIGHSYWFNALERHDSDPDNAWRFGVLPQAIHAAESARMERFLADLFKAAADAAAAAAGNAGTPPSKPKPDKANEAPSWERFTDEFIKSRDTFEKDLREAFEACYPTSADKDKSVDDAVPALLASIGGMSPKVRLVGSGHGEKLVITDKSLTSSQR